MMTDAQKERLMNFLYWLDENGYLYFDADMDTDEVFNNIIEDFDA